MAFRSVPRPSSPPGAKASTERPYHAHRLAIMAPKNPIPPCTGTIQPATHLIFDDSPEDLSPSRCRLSPRNARNIPKIQTDAQCTSSLSLTLLCNQAAGIRSLNLLRSDMQLDSADAPNPDSRFKEHLHSHPQAQTTHDKARPNRSPNARCHDFCPTATMVTSGGGGRYRTDDPLLAKQVLSH
jgi:hypothetical protein